MRLLNNPDIEVPVLFFTMNCEGKCPASPTTEALYIVLKPPLKNWKAQRMDNPSADFGRRKLTIGIPISKRVVMKIATGILNLRWTRFLIYTMRKIRIALEMKLAKGRVKATWPDLYRSS